MKFLIKGSGLLNHFKENDEKEYNSSKRNQDKFYKLNVKHNTPTMT